MSAPTPPPGTGEVDLGPGGFDRAFLGVDAPLPRVGARQVVELTYTHFTVVLDTVRALAACAAVNVDGSTLVDLPRADVWLLDPRVPENQQSGGGALRG